MSSVKNLHGTFWRGGEALCNGDGENLFSHSKKNIIGAFHASKQGNKIILWEKHTRDYVTNIILATK